MSTIIADSSMEVWFEQIRDVTEILDSNGNVLGTFSPRLSAAEHEQYEKAKQHFDPIEMERIAREQHGKGRQLKEIWKDLEARERKS